MSKIHFQIADEFSWWAIDYITKKKNGETLNDMFRLYRARLLNFVNSYCRHTQNALIKSEVPATSDY